MYYVIWKYKSAEKAHGSTMTSRQLWMLRLDATVEVLEAKAI
jgi:hypothetical protein